MSKRLYVPIPIALFVVGIFVFLSRAQGPIKNVTIESLSPEQLQNRLTAALDSENETEAQRIIDFINARESQRLHPAPADVKEAFWLLARYGSDNLFSLVRSRLHPNVRDETGWPLFFDSFNAGILVFPFFMEEGVDRKIQGGPGGWTPLTLATAMEADRVLDELTRIHTDDNVPLEDGSSALHLALRANRFQPSHDLLMCHPSMMLKDRYGRSPLFYAVQSEEAFELFIKFQGKKPYTNVREKLADGTTLLHAAAEYGHFGVAELLLKEHRFDPNETDANGETALHKAWLRRDGPDVNSIPILAEHGALHSKRDNQGRTPIDAFLEKLRAENESLRLSPEGAKLLDGRSEWYKNAAELLTEWDPAKRKLPVPKWPTSGDWTVYPDLEVRKGNAVVGTISRKVKIQGRESLMSLGYSPRGSSPAPQKIELEAALLMGHLATLSPQPVLLPGRETVLRFPKDAGRLGGAMALQFRQKELAPIAEPLGSGSFTLQEGISGISRSLIASPDRLGRKVLVSYQRKTHLLEGNGSTQRNAEVTGWKAVPVLNAPMRFPLDMSYRWKLAGELDWNPVDVFQRTDRLPIILKSEKEFDLLKHIPATVPNTVKSRVEHVAY